MAFTTNYKLANIFNSKKTNTFTTGGLTILMIVLMLVLAILPAYKSITDQLKNNETKTKYLSDLKQKRVAMDSLSEEYVENKDLITLYQKYNGTKPNTEILLANFAKICEKEDCKLISISFDELAQTKDEEIASIPGILTNPVKLSMVGTIEQLDNVLSDLEDFPIPLNIKDVQYSHYLEKNGTTIQEEKSVIDDPRFTLSITLEYYLWSD